VKNGFLLLLSVLELFLKGNRRSVKHTGFESDQSPAP